MTLISCAVTAQLICAFGFAYADCLFSDAAAHIASSSDRLLNWDEGPKASSDTLTIFHMKIQTNSNMKTLIKSLN